MEHHVKLTNTVYRLLDYFPENEPLKNKAKEKALAILEGLTLGTENSRKKAREDADVLLALLKVAEALGWIETVNLLIISKEYSEILALHRLPDRQTAIKIQYSERQKKIIALLRERGRGQVSDIIKALPNVTKRTIRRDLDELLKTGIIVREGDYNRVVYKPVEIGQDGTDRT